MRVVTAGGSAAGLFSALLLARAGHDITVLDCDPVEPADDLDAAAATAFRPAAPQCVQAHAFLPRWRELLIERLPDVYADLLAAGLAEAPFPTLLPPTITDRAEQPGDERVTMLAGRRSTMDWVLRRAAAEQPGVTLRQGIAVTGLLATAGTPPHVTGVRTEHEDITADLVLDATGRRSAVDRWLTGIGAERSAMRSAECGLAYYTRHFRLRPSRELPGPATTRILLALDHFTVGLWCADNGTALFAVAPLVEDKRFRAVADPAVHDAVLRTVAAYRPWLDVLEPISDVYPMGGLHNTLRTFVVDGRPVATGLLPVGDSVCTTNPTFGRGLVLALQGAIDLVDLVDRLGDDPDGLARAYWRRVSEVIEPFYVDQAANDAERLADLRRNVFGRPSPPVQHRPDRVTFGQLRSVAAADPMLFRAFWRLFGMLSRPDDVYTDPAVVGRVTAMLSDGVTAPPVPQPSPEAVSAALAG